MDEIKDTSPKSFCFVLMPFDKLYDDLYQLGIKPACEDAGAYCERVDEQIYDGRVLDRIFNQIAKADIIVAVMTDRNPNVFYEVGYAHALGQPTILLTSKAEDIPFDLKHFPHIVYEDKITLVKTELAKRIEWFIDNPKGQIDGGKISIDIYMDDNDLSLGDASFKIPKNSIATPEITIHNNSSYTYPAGSFKIGVISEKICYSMDTTRVMTTTLPNGGLLHMLPDCDTLFPGAFTSFIIPLHFNTKDHTESELTIRIFTEVGTRDYKLTLIQD